MSCNENLANFILEFITFCGVSADISVLVFLWISSRSVCILMLNANMFGLLTLIINASPG